MKKHTFLYIILILTAYNMVQAQCAFEQYHKIGSKNGLSASKIIEDVESKSTFTFWDSTIDSANYQTQNNTEIWIVKNDSCGNRLWKKNIGFGEFTMDYFEDAIMTPDSNFLVVGDGEYTGQGGIYNGIIFKINRDGNVLWKKAYGGRNGLAPSSVVYNPYKNTFVISGRIERTGTRAWNRAYVFEIDSVGNMLNEQDIIINNDSFNADIYLQKMNKVVVLADSSIMGVITSQQADSVYLVKLTPDLDITWIRKPFSQGYTSTGIAMVDYDKKTNRLVVTAVASNTNDNDVKSWMMLIDSSGQIEKAVHIETQGLVFCLTNDGGYLMGYFSIFKYSQNFEVEWSKELFTMDPFQGNIGRIVQLTSGAIACIGVSVVRSKGEYTELYITQSHPNGGFVTTPEIEQNKNEWSIYPNPNNSGIFTLSGTHTQPYTVKVTDATGKQILNTTTYNGTIDVSGNPNGMYYLWVEDKNGSVLLKQAVVLVGER